MGRTHEVQNRSIQWLHKLGLAPTKKNLNKKEKKEVNLAEHTTRYQTKNNPRVWHVVERKYVR